MMRLCIGSCLGFLLGFLRSLFWIGVIMSRSLNFYIKTFWDL